MKIYLYEYNGCGVYTSNELPDFVDVKNKNYDPNARLITSWDLNDDESSFKGLSSFFEEDEYTTVESIEKTFNEIGTTQETYKRDVYIIVDAIEFLSGLNKNLAESFLRTGEISEKVYNKLLLFIDELQLKQIKFVCEYDYSQMDFSKFNKSIQRAKK